MSDKPRDLGRIVPDFRRQAPKRTKPAALRKITPRFGGGMSYTQECETFGLFRCVALKGTSAYHKTVNQGEIFEIPGNWASVMWDEGQIDILDIDLKAEKREEERLADEAKLRLRDIPEFQRERTKWMDGSSAAA